MTKEVFPVFKALACGPWNLFENSMSLFLILIRIRTDLCYLIFHVSRLLEGQSTLAARTFLWRCRSGLIHFQPTIRIMSFIIEWPSKISHYTCRKIIELCLEIFYSIPKPLQRSPSVVSSNIFLDFSGSKKRIF